MLKAYLNYPNSRVTVHGVSVCEEIQKARKQGQRRVYIDRNSRGEEIERFRAAHRFASTSLLNDMWVTVNLEDLLDEQRVLDSIVAILAARYAPFRNAMRSRHC